VKRALALVLVGACTPRAEETPVIVAPVATAPIAIAPARSVPKSDAPWSILGEWRGRAMQSDGQSFDVAVSFTSESEGPCATVTYPDGPCAGELFCTTAVRGGSLRLIERITDNAARCASGGQVHVSPIDEQHLAWEWHGTDGFGWLSARAELAR
jgi:hypothetical protein